MFAENLRRLLARLDAEIPLPPELEPRWLERLGELRARWSVSDSGQVTEGQVMALVRMRHEVAANDAPEEDEETRIMEVPLGGLLTRNPGAVGDMPTLPSVKHDSASRPHPAPRVDVAAPLPPGQA